MSEPKAPVFRSRISDRPFELRIVIPLRWHWFEIFLFGGFLFAWSGGLGWFIVSGQMIGPDIFHELAGFGIWLGGTGVILYLLLWNLAGREVITIGYKALTTRREMLGLGMEREFELSRVRRPHFAPFDYRPRNQQGASQEISPAALMHQWCGDVVFEYDDQTHYFGVELGREEVKYLVELIDKRRDKAYLPMPRVVSLIASATEIVCALDFEGQLVGRSHECDFPPAVQKLPAVTEPKFAIEGSSAEIDRRVKETLEQSVSVYHVDAEKLRQLKPDVIVTQSHCDVCAVSEKDVERAVRGWTDAKPRVVTLSPNRLEDVWSDIRKVADALDVPQRGEELVAALRKRMTAIAEKTRALRNWPTVVCIEWIEPLMAAGNWMPELITMAGGMHPFGKAGKHAPRMSWEGLVEKDPEVIVILPCGWDIARTMQDMAALTAKPEWPRLQAVHTGRVYLADGNQYFNRPGPRLVESLEILAEILHPDVFRFGHEGTGWQRF